jgi:dihydroorotase-like cyclic amidohydrolase
MLSDVVRLTSNGPAAIFSLARKGRIAPGYEADLVFVNPEERWTIEESKLWTKCGWTPFAGRQVKGRVEQVYLRGRLVYSSGEMLVEPGYGQPVEITLYDDQPTQSPRIENG